MRKHQSRDWRRGFERGWRNEPMPANAGADMRNGWHVGRLRLIRATADALGVRGDDVRAYG